MRWITWTPRQKNTINLYFFKADFYGSTCIFWLFSASILSYHASYFSRTRSCPNSTPQPHHTDTQTPLPLPHLHESVQNTISETLSHPPRAAGTGEVPPHRQTALHTPLPRLHLLGLCGSVCSPPGNLLFQIFHPSSYSSRDGISSGNHEIPSARDILSML